MNKPWFIDMGLTLTLNLYDRTPSGVVGDMNGYSHGDIGPISWDMGPKKNDCEIYPLHLPSGQR